MGIIEVGEDESGVYYKLADGGILRPSATAISSSWVSALNKPLLETWASSFKKMPALSRIRLVGNTTTPLSTGFPAVSAMTPTRVICIDGNGNTLYVMNITYAIDGSITTAKGASLSVGSTNRPAVAGLSASYFAFISTTHDSLRCYYYNGSTIALFGNALSLAVTAPSIDALSSNTIVLVDTTGLATYTFDGTDWSLVGNKLSLSLGVPTVAALDSNRAAVFDSTGDLLYCYSFDGTDWTQEGNSLSISGRTNPNICAMNSSTIIFCDDASSANESIRVYQFDGTNWEITAIIQLVEGTTYCDVCALTGNMFLYVSKTTTYPFSVFEVSSAVGGPVIFR
jgi:hypothetical protein